MLGMAICTACSILMANGFLPHPVKTFRVSRDPNFEIKRCDVFGLHVDPPDNGVVIQLDN